MPFPLTLLVYPKSKATAPPFVVEVPVLCFFTTLKDGPRADAIELAKGLGMLWNSMWIRSEKMCEKIRQVPKKK
jgi:hypothetical protein